MGKEEVGTELTGSSGSTRGPPLVWVGFPFGELIGSRCGKPIINLQVIKPKTAAAEPVVSAASRAAGEAPEEKVNTEHPSLSALSISERIFPFEAELLLLAVNQSEPAYCLCLSLPPPSSPPARVSN